MKVQEEAIDLATLLTFVRKRIKMILLFSGLGLIVASIITFGLTVPMYQVKTQLIVHSAEENSQTTAQEIQGNVQIINTYNDILVSPIVLNQVIGRLHLNSTSSDLQRNIKLSTETNSQVITMSVINKNKFVAKEIANTTVDVFKTEVAKIMNVNNVSVLAPAVVGENMSPVSPNKKINLAMGIFIGAIVGFSVAFIIEVMDKTVKTTQDIEDLIGIPVYGEIPMIKMEGKGEKNA